MSLSPGRPPEEVAAGCWRIALPDPFPPGVVAVFVLSGPTGPWLLDAGPPGDDAASALDEGLGALGLDRGELRGVLLSHDHLDHAGGLEGWRPDRLAAHAATARRLEGGGADGADRAEALLRRAGAPADARERLRRYREPGRAGDDGALRVDLRLEGEEGETAGLAGWRWTRVRGHAPGHLLVHRPDDGTMLSFDQFMDRLKTPLALEDPDADPWGDYLRSLERAVGIGPTAMHPSHTGSVRPAVPWLERRRDAMDRSLERISDALREGADTAWRAVDEIYPRDPGPGRKALLVREALAGLRRLAAVGAARRRTVDGVERYRPA